MNKGDVKWLWKVIGDLNGAQMGEHRAAREQALCTETSSDGRGESRSQPRHLHQRALSSAGPAKVSEREPSVLRTRKAIPLANTRFSSLSDWVVKLS